MLATVRLRAVAMWRWAIPFLAGAAGLHALPALGPASLPVVLIAAGMAAVRRWPLLAAAVGGLAWSHLLATDWVATSWPCARDREVATLEGKVAGAPLVRPGRTDFDLEVTRSTAPAPWPRQVRVSWYEADRPLAPGEHWRLELRLRCRRGLVNPGAPDRELALLRERIDATAYVAGNSTPIRLAVPQARSLERLRARIAGSIASALPPGPSIAVLQGLAVGVRGAIPDRLWEAFSVTGVAHLIAISGLHVTGCALFALAGIRLLARIPGLARLPARVATEGIVVVGVSALYTFLSGASLPALRTLAMVALFAALRLLRRSVPLDRTLILAAVALVAADPLAIASTGFWLSFVATAALLSVAAQGGTLRRIVIGFARSQVAVTVLLTPVLAIAFGRISLVSPLVNAIAVPLFSFVLLPSVLAGTVIAAAEPSAWPGLWRALAALLDGAWPWLESIAAWPGVSWAPAGQPVALVAAVGIALFIALLLPLAGLRLAAAALLAALCLGRSEPVAEGAFTLTAIDVGQGLAVVIETANRALVFDTGPAWPASGTAAQVSLLPYLRARGIRAVDRLVVSHDDKDHAGGAERLQSLLAVPRMPGRPGERAEGDETCRRGDSWQWDRVAFRVLHPPAGFEGSDNDRSCAILVSGSGGRALLLADPEAAAEAELVTQALSADVVLLPHHGSRSSSGAALVAAVSARYGIASAGFGNRWGMPDSGVVARWRGAGTTVFATAEQGAVRAKFAIQPGAIEIDLARRDVPRWWRSAPAR
jgi:competence protein ComEC